MGCSLRMGAFVFRSWTHYAPAEVGAESELQVFIFAVEPSHSFLRQAPETAGVDFSLSAESARGASMKIARLGQDANIAGVNEHAVWSFWTARMLRVFDLVGAGEFGVHDMIL